MRIDPTGWERPHKDWARRIALDETHRYFWKGRTRHEKHAIVANFAVAGILCAIVSFLLCKL